MSVDFQTGSDLGARSPCTCVTAAASSQANTVLPDEYRPSVLKCASSLVIAVQKEWRLHLAVASILSLLRPR